jgi:hypothetical protein
MTKILGKSGLPVSDENSKHVSLPNHPQSIIYKVEGISGRIRRQPWKANAAEKQAEEEEGCTI